MEGLLPGVLVELKANISEFTAKMGEAKAEMSKVEGHGKKTFGAMAGVGKAALLGIGASAAVVGFESLKMADKFEESHANLQTAITNSGHKMSEFQKTINLQHKSFEGLGYSNAEYEKGLARLTQATNDPKKALENMGVAADVAAARHIDLEAASNLVGLAAEGNTKKLKQLLPDLNLTAGSAKDLAKAHDGVSKATDKLNEVETKLHDGRLKGKAGAEALQKAHEGLTSAQEKLTKASSAGEQAINVLGSRFADAGAKQADTFKGKVKALHAQFEDLMKNIGLKLIPVLEKLGEKIADIISWFEKHSTVAKVLGGVIAGALTASIVAYIAKLAIAAGQSVVHFAKMIASGVQWVASTVAGIATAIASYVAQGVAMAATAVIAAGSYVIAMGAAAVATLAAAWPILAIIAAVALVGVAIYELATHWDEVWSKIKEVASSVWESIKSAVSGGFSTVLRFFSEAPGKVLSALGDLGGKLWDWASGAMSQLLKSFISGIAAVIRFQVELPGKILNALGDLGSKLWDWASGAMSQLLSGFILNVVKVIDWAKELPKKIIDGLGNIGRMLWDVGVDMIKGLINGIGSMANKAGDAVKNVLGGAVDAGKKLLHIGSPSKVFHEMGTNTLIGYVNGIDAMRGAAVASMGQTMDQIVGSGARSISGSLSVGASGGLAVAPLGRNGGGSFGGVTININVQGDSLDTNGLAKKLEPALRSVALQVKRATGSYGLA